MKRESMDMKLIAESTPSTKETFETASLNKYDLSLSEKNGVIIYENRLTLTGCVQAGPLV